MIPEVRIRKAEPHERADIEVLMSTCYHGIEDAPIDNFIVAVIDSKIIAAVCLETGSLTELHSIAVYPNHRGKGIGRLLMDFLIDDIEEETVLFTRTTSPVFFEKVGFIRLDDSEKKELWDDCANCNRFNNCKQSVLRLEIKKR